MHGQCAQSEGFRNQRKKRGCCCSICGALFKESMGINGDVAAVIDFKGDDLRELKAFEAGFGGGGEPQRCLDVLGIEPTYGG